MDDITPSLLSAIQTDFQEMFDKSSIISSLYAKVRDGTATYVEANEFAIETGDILAKVFSNNLSSAVLPDGKMYYNIAERIIGPMMSNNYDLISEVTQQVQSLLNKSASIGIKAIKPELNQDRIDGIINKVSSIDHYDDVAWVLDEPIKNFSQSIVDDSIRENAEFHAKSGMKSVIVRKVAGNCCDWCKEVAGTYTYPDNVPRDVYRRHQRCRCTVDYVPKNGKVQNVHTRQWRTEEEISMIEKRKSVGINSLLGENITPYYYGTATPKKGLINKEEGYNSSLHVDEIRMAKLLHNMFGGDITLLNEVNEHAVKTADYLWRGKLWDLKTVTTEKSADSAIRKGLKQIKNNPGGIILDYRNKKISTEELQKVIESRMKRGFEKDTDIMVVLDSKTIKVYRYKK